MAGAIELYTLTNTIGTIHLEPYRLENMYTISKGKSPPTSTNIFLPKQTKAPHNLTQPTPNSSPREA